MKYKLLLSKIKIAQLENKHLFTIQYSSSDLVVLNLLWKNGLIYGYSRDESNCIIFLKYNNKGLGLFTYLSYSNELLSNNLLKNKCFLNPKARYFVFCAKKHIFYVGQDFKFFQFGGKIIAKL